MMVSGTDKRAFSITKQVGCVVNGLTPDGRALMLRGKEEAAQYEKMFGIKIPGTSLADRLAMQVQMKTIYASFRPFGTSIILSTHDHLKGPALWMIEPSGACYQYFGCASGRGKQLARNEIEKGKFQELTVEEAIPKVAKLLLKSQDEMKEKKQELELTTLQEVNGEWRHRIVDRPIVDKLCADALAEIDKEDQDMN